MAFSFFNTPKPKPFHYRPRYYDERKERLEKMKAQAKAEADVEKSRVQYVGLQRGFLQETRESSKLRSGFLNRAANARFFRYFLILLFLMGLFYFISPDVFKAFLKIK